MGELLHTRYGPGVQTLIYADDIALVFPRRNLQTAVQPALDRFQHHCSTLGLKINLVKSKYMVFGLPLPDTPLKLGDTNLTLVNTHQYLGVWLDQGLTFRSQVKYSYLRERMGARNKVLRLLSWRGLGASTSIKRQFCVAAVRSVLDYYAPCLPGISQHLPRQLEVAQNDAMRSILAAPRWTRIEVMREECQLPHYVTAFRKSDNGHGLVP